MRLSEKEKSAILEAIREEDPTAEVYLFGSRADDARREGDIDLLIHSEPPNTQCQVYRPKGTYKGVVDSDRFQVKPVTSSRVKTLPGKQGNHAVGDYRGAVRWLSGRRRYHRFEDRYGR